MERLAKVWRERNGGCGELKRRKEGNRAVSEEVSREISKHSLL